MGALAKSVREQRRAQRAKILRELEQSIRNTRSSKAKGLRQEVRAAKGERKGKLTDARKRCQKNKKQARAEARQDYRAAAERDRAQDKDERERIKAELKARRLDRKAARLAAKEAKIQAALDECKREREAIEQESGALITEREEKLKQQLEDIRIYREVDRRNASIARERRQERASAKVRRSESDDEVLGNIDPSLHPLFHRVKGTLRNNPRMSRTEAFMQYVHDHPDEAIPRWEATYTDTYLAREYEKHLQDEGQEPAPRAPKQKPTRQPKQARRTLPAASPAVQPVVSPAALRALGAPAEPPAPSSALSKPAAVDPKTFSIRGVRAVRLKDPSPEVDNLLERAAIRGASSIAWRVGDLEVVRSNGHVYVKRLGAPIVTIKSSPDLTTREVVQRWLDQEATTGPFVQARAPQSAEAPAQPEATAERRPVGVHVEEADGRVRVRFDERPRPELRERLKRGGFKWKPPAWEARATAETRQVAAEVASSHAAPAPARSEYEGKRLARVERLKTRAQRAKQEAESTIERAREMAAVIPFGEPIHVGHHSEKRDRRYRAKIHKTFDQGFTKLGEAEALARRAAAAERNTAISTDDPEAIQKLEAKLRELEHVRSLLPRAREVLKKAKAPERARPALIALGLDEDIAARLTPGPPLQRWAHTTVKRNLDGEIQRVRRRIDDLRERLSKNPHAPEQIGDARIVEQDNRVRILFPGKPDEATRKALRSHGFLWAPSAGAWQRKASEGAWYWARSILRGRTPAAPPSSPAAPESSAERAAPEPDPSPGTPAASARGALSGARWSPERQARMFAEPRPAESAPLVLHAPPAPEPRRAPAAQRRTAEPEGPRRNLAFEDLKPSEMSAWERTPSLFGQSGPVPPPQPGEQRAPKQKRLPF